MKNITFINHPEIMQNFYKVNLNHTFLNNTQQKKNKSMIDLTLCNSLIFDPTVVTITGFFVVSVKKKNN